ERRRGGRRTKRPPDPGDVVNEAPSGDPALAPAIGLGDAGLVGDEGDADIFDIDLRPRRAGETGRVERGFQAVANDARGRNQLDIAPVLADRDLAEMIVVVERLGEAGASRER